jgi:DNA-binding ferritin-like protein (Dps family)
MNIYRAEKLAQDYALKFPEWDKKFFLVGPAGIKQCVWLDPYFGMFAVNGIDGFLMSGQVPPGVEALMPAPNGEAD